MTMKRLMTSALALFGLLMVAMPSVASAEIVRVYPRECATDGGTRGGRARPVHDGRVLSPLGMRQPVVPPSSSVDVPLTSPAREEK